MLFNSSSCTIVLSVLAIHLGLGDAQVTSCIRLSEAPWNGQEDAGLGDGCGLQGPRWAHQRTGPVIFPVGLVDEVSLETLLNESGRARFRLTRTKQDVLLDEYMKPDGSGRFVQGSQLFTGGASNAALLEALLGLDGKAKAHNADSPLKDVDSRRIASIGRAGTGSMLHSHSCSWLFLGVGRKQWLFFPPSFQGYGLEEEEPCPFVKGAAPVFSGEGPVTCTQEAGDMLLIPDKWWHATCNEGPNLAVAWGAQGVSSAWPKVQRAARDGDLMELGRISELPDEDAEVSELPDEDAEVAGPNHPVYVAAAYGRRDFLGMFVARFGPGPLALPNEAHSVLRAAVANGHLDVVEFLLQEYKEQLAQSNETHLSLSLAARMGFVEVCQEFLNQGQSNLEMFDSEGSTALMMGARGGHTKVLRLLLDHRAEPIAEDHNGATVLHKAALYGPADAVETLLSALGRRAGLAVAKADAYDATSIHIAAEAGHRNVLQALLQARNTDGTPEALLQMGGTYTAAMMLGVPHISHVQMSPLHLAVLKGHVEASAMILEEGGHLHQELLAAKDGSGQTALELAYEIGELGADVRVLLEAEVGKGRNAVADEL